MEPFVLGLYLAKSRAEKFLHFTEKSEIGD